MARPKGPNASRYVGVTPTNGRFVAYVTVNGKHRTCGHYDDELEAAIARDRAVLFHRLPRALNVPASARGLGPCAPEELALAQRFRKKQETCTSKYLGVTYNAKPRNWQAWAPRNRPIAPFEREEDAAVARDRVVLAELGPGAELNFPDAGLEPASLEEMRVWARTLRKQRHLFRYEGVRKDPNKATFCWVAEIKVDEVRYSLGNWCTEREAVIARDRAELYLRPGRALLNLPEISGPLGPATPEELSAMAHRRFKETTTSKYRGVHWNDSNDGWIAKIEVNGKLEHLGTFRNEERAAEAYDEAARRLLGALAKLNFPD